MEEPKGCACCRRGLDSWMVKSSGVQMLAAGWLTDFGDIEIDGSDAVNGTDHRLHRGLEAVYIHSSHVRLFIS